MRFDYTDKDFSSISADVILVFAVQKKVKNDLEFKPLKSFEKLNDHLSGALARVIKVVGFKAKAGEVFSFYPENQKKTNQILVIGLGEEDKIDLTIFRDAIGAFAKSIGKKAKSVSVSIPSKELGFDEINSAQVFSEGILLGLYKFNKYKKEEKNEKVLSEITIETQNIEKTKKGVSRGELFAEATNLTRNLVNEQPSIATPNYLAEIAMKIAKKDPHIKCKIIDEKEARKLGMDAFLGIARASSSSTPPKFIHLEYTPIKKTSKEKLALVGKGITFDSGGINVKPGDHMMDMKIDMSGAAIVLGVFSVITQIKPSYSVIGLVAATPNLISSRSIVPGDVVRAMNGKTIEILNTDAEGRVTMADSLSYAVKEKATKVIDFATLTGAAVVAMGTEITALFANDESLKEDILNSANKAGEKMWELPLEESYKELNKSEVADIANIPNSRYGGTITAALFLQEFINDGIKWAHLDIAGPTYSTKSSDIGPKGATGHGVRTVLEYLSI